MTKRYDYVVLDLDGTLYSHSKYLKACRFAGRKLLSYAESENVSPKLLKRLTERMRNGKVTYTICEICREYNIKRMRFMNQVYDLDPAMFGIKRSKRLIREIKKVEKVSDIALFTNTPKIWALKAISALGIGSLIDRKNIITLERLDNARYFKPSRASFLELFRILHTTPDRIIFLDDDKENVDAARKLGVRSILVCNDGRCHLDGHSSSRTVYEELGALANSDK